MFNHYCNTILEGLADADVVAAVRRRTDAGTAVWARTDHGLVLLSGETVLVEIVTSPEGDDFEVSDALLAEAGL